MRLLERISLYLVSIGTAAVWIIPYLAAGRNLPEWLITRFYLLICIPAVVLGCWSYQKYGGFARSKALCACVGLMAIGYLWTDETERGRALLLAAAVLVTLPIAALINRHRYWFQFATAFALSAAGTVLIASPQASTTKRWGTLLDRTLTPVTNADGLGVEAALGLALLLMVAIRSPRRVKVILIAPMMALAAAVILAASRTAAIALAGSLLLGWARHFRRDALSALTILLTTLLVVSVSLGYQGLSSETSLYRSLSTRFYEEGETISSFGDRAPIWAFGLQRLGEDRNWVIGFGTGGIDKVLGESYELRNRIRGRDSIWRAHSHNTYVSWAMAFGIVGLAILVWLISEMMRRARQLDAVEGSWVRVTILSLIGLLGFGTVINQEACWIAVGALLWAMLSEESVSQAPKLGWSRSSRSKELTPSGEPYPVQAASA